jgi:transposase
MHVDTCYSRQRGKIYKSILLRESYREHGKPKHRTIVNLTNRPPEEVEAIRLALKHKKDLTVLGSLKEIETSQGLSVGAVVLLSQVASRLGIPKALGPTEEARLVLWQVMARLIQPCSRLATVRMASGHAVLEVLRLEPFNEDDLYHSLSWLEKRQSQVEKSLFRNRANGNKGGLFLYDVTSSYLEGDKNELADFGYNRDKKRGKREIVIGLLTDAEGYPVSVQVYRGNTQDVSTFEDQVKKTCEELGVEEVTFVGDRGMIKTGGIKVLREHGFHYITAITKSQIEALVKRGVFQLELFHEDVCEVIDDGVRYVLRRNPFRAEELKRSREDRERALMELVRKKNEYLASHRRADVKCALRIVREKAWKLKVSEWLNIETDEREIVTKRDPDKFAEVSRYDGCYALKTDLPKDSATAELVHSRYKDLGLIEGAFRDMKTEHLEIRPVNVRKENHTRSHTLIVMLAYLIRKELERCWKEVEVTVQEGIEELSQLCGVLMEYKDQTVQNVPAPRPLGKRLLKLAGVSLPSTLPMRKKDVYTRKKIANKRK